MMWIALAAAIHLAAPAPINATKWITNSDVPDFLFARERGLWLVKIRLSVATDGKLKSCEVEGSSGIPELDTYTCRTILKRAKFNPATGADGSPAFGIYRTFISFVLADAPRDVSKLSDPDLDLTVLKLPPGVKSPSSVRVMFAVDQAGNMSSCAAEPPPPNEHVDNNPALVSVACDQLLKNYKPIPARDVSGKAIASVQDAEVRFTTGHS